MGFGPIQPRGLCSGPMKPLLLLLGTLCVVSTALATTYVRVEKDGTKTYSDRPIPGGQPVELEPAQTYSKPDEPASTSSSTSNVPSEQRLVQQMDDFRYASCTLSPENEATFTNPQGVPISVQLQPNLRPRDVITLSVDGQVVGNSAAHVLQPANRGTHTAQVTVKDTYGRELCSASTTFHVFRPSLNMPRRQ
jgi:hypothetical protein